MTSVKKSCKNLQSAGPLHDPFDSVDFLRMLRPQTKVFLKQQSRVQQHFKGHILFMHADSASCFYFVESGWVKLFRETLDGDEAILDVLPPGSVFGEAAYLEGGLYSYGAEIIENSTIISFPLTALENEVSENSDFAMSFLRHLARKGSAKDKEIELRSVQNAAQRIGCFLLRLCQKSVGNAKTIHLPWEKSLISARLGMTPETFSRSLAKLHKDVGIQIRGSTVEVTDVAALVRYTCSACSSLYPCDHS